MRLELPADVNGLRLCKVVGDELILCEAIEFSKGRTAVDTALRRAAISGQVGPLGDTGDFWADLMTPDGTWVETVALSRGSWNALKNKWARCKIQRFGDD